MDRLELVGRQDLGRAVTHPRLGPRPLLREGAAGMRLASARATAPEAFARGRVHVRHAGLPIKVGWSPRVSAPTACMLAGNEVGEASDQACTAGQVATGPNDS